MFDETSAAGPHESTPASGFSRRTLVKGAAWSAPIIALTVAAPTAAASGELPPATFAYTGGSLGVRLGNVSVFDLNGIDGEGAPAALPIGTTVTVSPSPGVTLALVSYSGVTMVDNGDNTFTFTVESNDVSKASILVRVTGGAVGPGIDYDTTLSIEPYSESFNIPIIP